MSARSDRRHGGYRFGAGRPPRLTWDDPPSDESFSSSYRVEVSGTVDLGPGSTDLERLEVRALVPILRKLGFEVSFRSFGSDRRDHSESLANAGWADVLALVEGKPGLSVAELAVFAYSKPGVPLSRSLRRAAIQRLSAHLCRMLERRLVKKLYDELGRVRWFHHAATPAFHFATRRAALASARSRPVGRDETPDPETEPE